MLNRLTHQISEREKKNMPRGERTLPLSSVLISVIPSKPYCTNLNFNFYKQLILKQDTHIKMYGVNMISSWLGHQIFSAKVSDGSSQSSQGVFCWACKLKSSWSTVCDRSVPQNHVISVDSLSQSFSYTWSSKRQHFAPACPREARMSQYKWRCVALNWF